MLHEFVHPLSKLRRISQSRRQLWVVAYIDEDSAQERGLVDCALSDVEASMEGGADAAVLISEWCGRSALEKTVAEVRKRYPRFPLGVNYLGTEAEERAKTGLPGSEPYGYRESFRLARDYGLELVWTDFSGVDLIEERPEVSPHAIEAERRIPAGGDFFYVSGVHMKYSTLRDPAKPVERSALQAMGWVDGVVMTGEKTGSPCDLARLARVRAAIGSYPLGVASGVSAANVESIAPYVDFCLVASSLQGPGKRIDVEAVLELRRALGSERAATR